SPVRSPAFRRFGAEPFRTPSPAPAQRCSRRGLPRRYRAPPNCPRKPNAPLRQPAPTRTRTASSTKPTTTLSPPPPHPPPPPTTHRSPPHHGRASRTPLRPVRPPQCPLVSLPTRPPRQPLNFPSNRKRAARLGRLRNHRLDLPRLLLGQPQPRQPRINHAL